jgi:aryl-alcohol dehydrogenase-like predicted oxidoreductase
VHPVTALQPEYSLWTRGPEAEAIPLVRELGIGFVAYPQLGRGFLTGRLRSQDQLDTDDYRMSIPRFIGSNFDQNLRIVNEVEAVAEEAGAGRARLASRTRRRHCADPLHQASLAPRSTGTWTRSVAAATTSG